MDKPLYRRNVLRGLVGVSGAWALRSMATGLPISFLMDPLNTAYAQEPTMVDPAKAQFAVIAVSDAGEPLNANGPGSYDFPEMVHSNAPEMAGTKLKLGSTMTTAAQLWSTLPQWVLDRMAYVHHATGQNNHGVLTNVMRLNGQTKAAEMIPSIYAKHLAPTLKTLQIEPAVTGGGEEFEANGVHIQSSPPSAWRDLLTQYVAEPEALAKVRNDTVNAIYAALKSRGNRSQLRYLDRLAKSTSDAKKLAGKANEILLSIKDDGNLGQLQAAVAIIKMNLSPVVVVGLNLGLDNHADPGLAYETAQSIDAFAALNAFFTLLKSNGLEDKVTFSYYGIFGRTFGAGPGRDHWGPHSASVIIGKNVKAGIYGGLVRGAGHFVATGIDSASGAKAEGGGDIDPGQTLPALGKTVGAALGIPPAVMESEVNSGKVIRGALV